MLGVEEVSALPKPLENNMDEDPNLIDPHFPLSWAVSTA